MLKKLLGAEQTVSKSEGSLSGCCPDVIIMERLLSIDNVSKMLGVTKATIYSWTSKNKIPHIKLSKRLLKFREREIMAWVSARSVCTDSYTPPAKQSRRVRVSIFDSDDFIERIISNAKDEVLN